MVYKRQEIGERRWKKLQEYVNKISPIRKDSLWKCCGSYSNSGCFNGICEESRLLSHIYRRIIFRGDRKHLNLVIKIFGLRDGVFVLKRLLRNCINAQKILLEYIDEINIKNDKRKRT